MVCLGNHYSIANVSPTSEAQLFFAQARKIRTSEEEDATLAGNPQEQDKEFETSLSRSARRATSVLPPVEEEAESDEEPVRPKGGAGSNKR